MYYYLKCIIIICITYRYRLYTKHVLKQRVCITLVWIPRHYNIEN